MWGYHPPEFPERLSAGSLARAARGEPPRAGVGTSLPDRQVPDLRSNLPSYAEFLLDGGRIWLLAGISAPAAQEE